MLILIMYQNNFESSNDKLYSKFSRPFASRFTAWTYQNLGWTNNRLEIILVILVKKSMRTITT